METIKITTFNYFFNETEKIKLYTPDEVITKFFKTTELTQPYDYKIPAAFEIVDYDCKIFMDIENCENENVIYDIIESFKKYVLEKYNITLSDYCLTHNSRSRHPGHSYHLIFTEYYMTLDHCKNLIFNFVDETTKFSKYIDTYVYSHGHIMRLPYQHNIESARFPKTDYRKFMNKDLSAFDDWVKLNFFSVHEIIHQSEHPYGVFITWVKDCKIFNIDDIPENKNHNIFVYSTDSTRIDILRLNEKYLPKIYEELNKTPVIYIENQIDMEIHAMILCLKDRKFTPSLPLYNLIKFLNDYFKEHNTYVGFKGISQREIKVMLRLLK